MTAPSAVTTVTAQIAALQAQLAALSAVPAPTSTGSTSAADFASALAASGTTTAAPATAASAATSPTFTTAATLGATGTTTTMPTSGTVTGSDIVADAKQYLGIPYVWGGESTSGLDCSGLVQKTLGDLGISVPRVAADQAHVGTPVGSLAQAQPGDLLFFGDPAYHVAIYAGNNQLVESPEPGKTVHVTDVYQTPTSIRRVVDQPGTTLATSTASTTSSADVARLSAAGIYPAVSAYAAQFAAAEQSNGLPAGLLAAVAQQESAGNASAVSAAGAQGLMQLMPATAAGYGVDAFDPGQSIQAAAKIFAQNLGQFGGSVPLALAAYNAGAGAVRQYGGVPPYSETQNYVSRIMATLAAGG